jgi:hypothetical protein
MGFLKLHDAAVESPEVIGLSDTAFRVWIMAICHAAHWALDGNPVRLPVLARKAAGRRGTAAVRELSVAGLALEHPAIPGIYFMLREIQGRELWQYGPSPLTRRAIDPDLRSAVYERDGFACLHCGTTDSLSLDHIHPYSKGGEDSYDNLQTLCRRCNSRKGARV